MDGGRLICCDLRKLGQDRVETILQDLCELEGIRPQDGLAETAKQNGIPAESPNQELPKLPNHTELVRHRAEPSQRHYRDSRQGLKTTPSGQAHAPGVH